MVQPAEPSLGTEASLGAVIDFSLPLSRQGTSVAFPFIRGENLWASRLPRASRISLTAVIVIPWSHLQEVRMGKRQVVLMVPPQQLCQALWEVMWGKAGVFKVSSI